MKDLLLIPSQYVRTVLRLAHTHLLGAHLRMEKTRERIGNRFHWPGGKRTIEDYCRSYPDCQIKAPRVQYRNPLVPLPIIGVPFERVAMDLVGPLVKTARGHQYILVIRIPHGILRQSRYAWLQPKVLHRSSSCVHLPCDEGCLQSVTNQTGEN
jgi:hypothetical protein